MLSFLYRSEECCVCYETTTHHLTCFHVVCPNCEARVNACPLCRRPFEKKIHKPLNIIPFLVGVGMTVIIIWCLIEFSSFVVYLIKIAFWIIFISCLFVI